MTRKFNTLLLLIIQVAMLTFLSACSKDEDADFRNRGVFKAKINGGEAWEPDQVVVFKSTYDRLQIDGLRKSDNSTISIAIGPKEVGEYTFSDEELSKEDQIEGYYRPSVENRPEGSKDVVYFDYLKGGVINITKFTQDSIRMTFQGAGQHFEITEGEIAIKIN